MQNINIYIKTNIKRPNQHSGQGIYYLEYIKNGIPETRGDTVDLTDTTKQKAMLEILLICLKRVNKPCEIKIITDSEYVLNLFGENPGTGWLEQWHKNGFLKKNGKPVSNAELVKEIDDICRGKRHIVTAVNEFNSYGKIMDEAISG